MHTITAFLARVARRRRQNHRPLRGRVIRREVLAEYGSQGRPAVRVEALTYANGANRIVRIGA